MSEKMKRERLPEVKLQLEVINSVTYYMQCGLWTVITHSKIQRAGIYYFESLHHKKERFCYRFD